MTKLVPSPDWFIGLDSLELCGPGGFLEEVLCTLCCPVLLIGVEQVTAPAAPLDAGTDNGFTFTSPNWATEPRGEVFTITNT